MSAQQKYKVFVTRELPPAVMEALRTAPEIGELRVNPHDRVLTREELLEGVKWADAVLSQLTDKIDEEVFKTNPKLKIVANYAVGYNNIDVAAATKYRIPITNTPGVLTDTTADLTWAIMMAVARRVVEADKFMRSGKYKGWAPLLFVGHEVSGKTLGIVGLGRIGYAMAMRAKGFGMKVLYTDIKKMDYDKEVGATFVDLETLLRESDFVTLHPFLDAKSTHMIDEPQLRMMKKTAYLVNAARGPVVNEKALVKALQEGWIAGAALDVFEREPLMEPELATMDNVVVVPHIASATIETRTKMGMMALENIRCVLRGEAPKSCVNSEIFASSSK